MTRDQELRFRLHCAVEPWAIEAPQAVQQAISSFLAGLVLAGSSQKIINEDEFVREVRPQVLDYVQFEIRARGAREN